LNTKGYFEKEEKRILDVFNRGLLKEFPNPDRTGCPGSDVLRRIATRQMPFSEGQEWLDHLGSCSPCYSDFLQLQVAFRRRRMRTLLAIAASILIVTGVTGRASFLKQRHAVTTQAAVLDLRNRSVPRGTESNPSSEPPLEISRDAPRLEVYLPLGSSEGAYELEITDQEANTVFTGSGIAKIEEGITSLTLAANLSSVSRGQYVLKLRRAGSRWNSYAMSVR
jgi:hypothetical protein